MKWAEVEEVVAGAIAVAAMDRKHYLSAEDCRYIAQEAIRAFQAMRLRICVPVNEADDIW